MKEHINLLDFLRGFAALGVVVFHFSSPTLPTLYPNYFTNTFFYGQYGVQVFFVISGFIIPYSMFRGGYQLSSYFRSLGKRFVRICPPSYVSILMSFALYYAAILLIKRPISNMLWPDINFTSIIGNLTYTVPYLDTLWFNGVFWTLAIEFQFYLLIGLLLPLLSRRRVAFTCLALLSLLALSFIELEWFFRYASFFVLGICLFLKKTKLLPLAYIHGLIILSFLCCGYTRGWVELSAGALAFGLIWVNANVNWRWTNFLGKISYSLYITHSVVGFSAEIILKRVSNIHTYPMGKIVMLFVYTSICIAFAALFFKLVEQPFIRYSKKIKLIQT
ncbi:MAG: acyltransferase family protein [Chitinophagales bacterium]